MGDQLDAIRQHGAQHGGYLAVRGIFRQRRNDVEAFDREPVGSVCQAEILKHETVGLAEQISRGDVGCAEGAAVCSLRLAPVPGNVGFYRRGFKFRPGCRPDQTCEQDEPEDRYQYTSPHTFLPPLTVTRYA